MSLIHSDFTKDTLRRLQLTQVEILDEIVRICERYYLRYYLVGGTLLGAVRHKGFIPWDDDLDIAMPRSDYDKFCSLCSTVLNEKYMLHDINSDNRYWLIFAKVRKKNTMLEEHNIAGLNVEKGIYVDIFPLDIVPKQNSLSQRICTKIVKSLSYVICRKRGLKVTSKNSVVAEALYSILTPFSIKTITRIQNRIMSRYNNKKSNPYYINYGSNYNTIKQTIPKDKYDPAILVEFEGKKYKAPRDYDYVLRRIYNDYMQLPPVEKRVLRHKPVKIDFGD